ncbi:hypothetical protein F4774DRAFT_78604 [Daldinia eschscholtzii]|nr:hypothetical protein F4774DRAFT_78604 [Daldinia eschscholtzii]
MLFMACSLALSLLYVTIPKAIILAPSPFNGSIPLAQDLWDLFFLRSHNFSYSHPLFFSVLLFFFFFHNGNILKKLPNQDQKKTSSAPTVIPAPLRETQTQRPKTKPPSARRRACLVCPYCV